MNTVVKIPFSELSINSAEALRFAGIKGIADEKILELYSNALQELSAVIIPKAVFSEVQVIFDDGGVYLDSDFVESQSLAKFLKGCEKAVVLAATAGIEADRLISRYSMVSPSRALMIDALAAETVEAFCNKLCRERFGVRECERFSPGYGDFNIEYQRKIISYLSAELNIGVHLTSSLMLAPSKSVTAIIPIKG